MNMTKNAARKISSKKPTGDDPEELVHFVENLKRQWMHTIDALPDPFLIVNKDYRILKANAAMAKIAGTE